MGARRPLHAELVRRRLCDDRDAAEALIAAGRVLVSGAPALNAARQVGPGEPVAIVEPPSRFVSRGGEKLDAALDRFGIDVTGWHALDAGASTGGFTDCLLQRGANHVTSVDVGRNQLHERLKADPRVTSLEKTDIRAFPPGRFEIVVADVSFVSLTKVLGPLLANLGPDAPLIALVKPQFEADPSVVSRTKGVIRDPAVWREVLEDVASAFLSLGTTIMGGMASPLHGADGNTEFLLHARAGAVAAPPFDAEALVQEGSAL